MISKCLKYLKREELYDDRGSVLVITLAIIVLSLVLLAALVMAVPVSYRSLQLDQDKLLALYASESGINHGIEILISEGYGGIDEEGTAESVPGGGDYHITLTPNEDGYYLRSSGTYQKATRVITVFIREVPTGTPLFSGDPPQVAMPDTPDWPEEGEYDEPPGGIYDGQVIGEGTWKVDEVTLSQDETLTLSDGAVLYVEEDFNMAQNANLVIEGDAVIYVGGDSVIRQNASIEGGGLEYYSSGDLDVYQNAQFLSDFARIIVGGNFTVFENVNLFTSSTKWNEVFVGGNTEIRNDAVVGNSEYINAIIIMPNDTEFRLANNAYLYGGLYLPDGTIITHPGLWKGGTIVGGLTTNSDTGDLNYTSDERIMEYIYDDGSGNGGEIAIGGWNLEN